MKNCVHDFGIAGCAILQGQDCKTCKFRKTAEDWRSSQRAAAKSLSERGLKVERYTAPDGARHVRAVPK